MRWRLPGVRSTLPASVALLLLPGLVAPQQLHASVPQHHDDSDRPSTLSVPLGPAGRDHPSSLSPLNVKSNDASALATMALAGSGHAVRAPPAQVVSSPSAGLAPQLHARSLQDWEVEDFVLLATVDGSIHARDRKTGASRWALEVPSSPAVESIYHRQKLNQSSFDRTQPEDDFIWIVEPSQGGSLYIYSPGPDAGLQRLGLSVKDLVDQTPYSGTDPAVTYTARKETTLYTVDARTGAILRVFSSHGSVPSAPECRRKGDSLDVDPDDDCESPSGTLVLGRIEYAVAIQNTETGDPICTLKYSEWAPNNRDVDLQSQHFQTMDRTHIYSSHDGRIMGFDHSPRNRLRYFQDFVTPVVRVFDIARPVKAVDADDAPDAPTPLVLLSQPIQPPDPDYGTLDDSYGRVFIDCTDAGGWYAMSEETYPMVTSRAPLAQCYQKDYFSHGQPLTSLSVHQQKAALAGVHAMNGPRGVRHVPRLAGAAGDRANDTPRNELIGDPREPALPPALRHSTIIRKGWDNALDIFVTLILLFLGSFIYFNSHHLQELAKQKLDLKNIIASAGQPALSTPSTPVATGIHRERSPARPVTNVTVDLADDHQALPPGGDATPTPRRDRGSLDSDTTPQVRFAVSSPGREGGDDDVDPLVLDPEKRPKKRARGKRGGKAHRRGKKPGAPDGEGATDRSVDDAATLAPPARADAEVPLTRTVSNEIFETDGVLRIGRLRVFTDVVLGHGSHGTVVYRGSFDGRDVAVKRMLVEFYDIASHEVSLLQESDDHNNVIRYFCREQAAGFLYIALELCPASLQEVVERPGDYPQLVNGGLDLPDILRQIVCGVRYLHSLKIVHRDLKPQNILTAVPRGRAASRGLRLLISDFGLCKKLEDNQSSFRATTAHAAGTSGWRAPELLVDDDMIPSPPGPESQHTESSEPAVVDPQTNRRATRSIDIFSLGCVFYYVLTRGCHPFDKNGKFMREANIVKGQYDLEELQRLGNYAFEAHDLIESMISLDPRRRPDAGAVLTHPFFWPPSDRLAFMCDVSDHFEFEPRDPPSDALLRLEDVAPQVMGPDMDFLRLLPKEFILSLGKQRKYTGSKMLDLLRALRNKRNHYNDMPEHLKTHIGGLPEGYLNFWTVRFPSLLMSCHEVIVALRLTRTDRFKRYFTPPE